MSLELGFDNTAKALGWGGDGLCENCCPMPCQYCDVTPSMYRVFFSGVEPCTCDPNYLAIWENPDPLFNLLNTMVFELTQFDACRWWCIVEIEETVKWGKRWEPPLCTVPVDELIETAKYLTIRATRGPGGFGVTANVTFAKPTTWTSYGWDLFRGSGLIAEEGVCCISPLINADLNGVPKICPRPCIRQSDYLSCGGKAYIEGCDIDVCVYCEELELSTPSYLQVNLEYFTANCVGWQFMPRIYAWADRSPNGLYILPRVTNTCSYFLSKAFVYNLKLDSTCEDSPVTEILGPYSGDIFVKLQRGRIRIRSPFRGYTDEIEGCATAEITNPESELWSGGKVTIMPFI